MAKMRFDGLDEYIRVLNRLANPARAEGAIKAAIYPGAGIVADEIRKGAEAHDRTGDMSSSMTIHAMRNEDGYIYAQIGFVGYDRYGTPNALKAYGIESGSSTSDKRPFIRPAVKRTKEKAEAAMAAELDEQIKRLMEE